MKRVLPLTLPPQDWTGTGSGLTLATTSYLCCIFNSDFHTSAGKWPQPRKTQINKQLT